MAFLYYANLALCWVSDAFPDFVLGTRGVCHLIICLFVVGYHAPDNNHRKIIGVFAGIFAGANAAEAYRVAYNFNSFVGVVQPPLTLVMVCVLFFVVYSRGNMAKILPRMLTGQAK